MNPVTDRRIDLAQPQRQSPVGIVFLGLRILRSLGIAQLAIIVLFFFQAPFDGPLIIIPLLAILGFGALSVLAWWRYTFRLTDDEVVVTKGVLRVDRLTVPVDRIQSMAIQQGLLHRMTGLVELSVDTAGSAEAELSIDAVDRPMAEELQRQVITMRPDAGTAAVAAGSTLDHAGHPAAPAPVDRVVFTHDRFRLLRAALTTWPLAGLIVLGPLFAFGEQLGNQVPDSLPEVDPSGARWWWIPVGLAIFFSLSIVLNIIRVFLQDWELTLLANATSLRRTSGLLSRTSKASSLARIQVVSANQNPVQRLAGLRSVRLSTIGEGDLDLIGCDDGQWETILELARPEPVIDPGVDRRISPASIWLTTRNTAVGVIAGAAAGWFVVGWWSLLLLSIVPVTWLMETVHVRNFRWRLGSELRTTRRVVDETIEITLPRKANVVSVTQSLFERRRGLATVQIVTAAGALSIGMVPLEEACAVRDIVLARAETDARPWM